MEGFIHTATIVLILGNTEIYSPDPTEQIRVMWEAQDIPAAIHER